MLPYWNLVQNPGDFSSQKKIWNMATRKHEKNTFMLSFSINWPEIFILKKTVPTVENWQNTALKIKFVSKCGVIFFSAFWVLFQVPILFQSNPVISIKFFPCPFRLFCWIKSAQGFLALKSTTLLQGFWFWFWFILIYFQFSVVASLAIIVKKV